MTKISNFFERIMQISEYKGFRSLRDFAVNGLNYSSSEKLNRLKDDKNKPSYQILTDISNKFDDVNMNWLLSGKGNMLNSQTDVETTTSEDAFEKALMNYLKKPGAKRIIDEVVKERLIDINSKIKLLAVRNEMAEELNKVLNSHLADTDTQQ